MKKRKKEKLSVTEKLSNITNIPFDMATHLPYIKMYSNREIIIEDAGKLVHYSEDCIKVKQGKNTVGIDGTDLKLICLATGDLRVAGFINSVYFE